MATGIAAGNVTTRKTVRILFFAGSNGREASGNVIELKAKKSQTTIYAVDEQLFSLMVLSKFYLINVNLPYVAYSGAIVRDIAQPNKIVMKKTDNTLKSS